MGDDRHQHDHGIDVCIVSDREIVRAGLTAVLRPCRGRVNVVAEAAGAAEAISQQGGPHASEMVVFQTLLARGDGLEDVSRLVEEWGDHHVLVLAGADEARFGLPVLQRGAAGFLLISLSGFELVHRLERMREGAVVLDPSLAGAEGRPGLEEPGGLWPGSQLGLSEKQSQVLLLLAQGDRTASVASSLGMSVIEVKGHVRSAYRRLDVRDRNDAMARLTGAGVFR